RHTRSKRDWSSDVCSSDLKNRRFDRHPELAEKLKWPVMSVGSLSAGGAGKTPLVAALVPLLRDAGVVPDILSRGYGRKSNETLRSEERRGGKEGGGRRGRG